MKNAALPRLAATGLALMLAGAASADPLVLRANGGTTYDSNIFRLPGGVEPADGKGQDDLILLGQLGGHYETNLSLQKVSLDGAVTRYDFQHHHDLSFTGISATGTWDWRIGSRFSGTASYDLQRRQTSFAEFRSQGRNIVTVKQPFFEARYQPGVTLFAYGNYRHIDATNTSDQLTPADYTSNAYAAGLGYMLRNDGQLRIGVKRTDTHFPNNQLVIFQGVIVALRNDYRLDEVEGTIVYPLGPKTALNGRVAYTERTVDQLTARNFSGLTGRLALDYRPSPLWSFELSGRKELSSADDIQTNFVTTKALAASAEYRPLDFWSLRLEGETARRNYEGFAIVAPTIGRDDRDRFVALSTAYLWRLGNRVDLSVRRETRNSTLDQLDYHDTTASATVTLAFGSPQVVR